MGKKINYWEPRNTAFGFYRICRYLRHKFSRGWPAVAVQLRWVHATDSLQSGVIDKVC